MAHNNTPTCHDSHSVNENFEKKTFLQRTHLFLGESSFCAKETACILRQDMTNVSRLIWSETWKKRNAPRSSFWVDPEVCLCWVFSQSWMTLKWRYSISLSGLFHLILTTTTFKWARWWVAGKGKIEKIYFYFPPRRLIRYTNDNIYWQGLYANIGSPVTASQPRAYLSSIIILSVILHDECWHCIEWVNSAPNHLISYPLCTLPLVRWWSSAELLAGESRSDVGEEDGGLGDVTDIKLSARSVSEVWVGVSVSSFWMSVSKCWLNTSSLAALASLNVSWTLVWMVIICLDSDTEEEVHSPVWRPPGL